MILRRCREVVEKFAKQPVRDVVITVPVFFNQAERRALVAAAEIAELNLLQVRFNFKLLVSLSRIICFHFSSDLDNCLHL